MSVFDENIGQPKHNIVSSRSAGRRTSPYCLPLKRLPFLVFVAILVHSIQNVKFALKRKTVWVLILRYINSTSLVFSVHAVEVAKVIQKGDSFR